MQDVEHAVREDHTFPVATQLFAPGDGVGKGEDGHRGFHGTATG